MGDDETPNDNDKNKNKNNDIVKVDGKDLLTFAQQASKSKLVPKDFQGRPEDLYIAMVTGLEVGLKPMQSLKSIAVINGRPCIWGDGLMALVQSSGQLDDIEQGFDEKLQAGYCFVTRKGKSQHKVYFSMQDAQKAYLLKKEGPWSTYPKRMCSLRARAFALRDAFADVLGGLQLADEVQDFQETNAKFKSNLHKEETIKPAEVVVDFDAEIDAEIVARDIPEEDLSKIYAKKEVKDYKELCEEDKEKLLAYIKDKY